MPPQVNDPVQSQPWLAYALMLQCCCSCDDLVAIMKLEFISMAMCIALRMHCTHRNDVSHCQEADEASPYFCKKRGVPLVAFKVAPKP